MDLTRQRLSDLKNKLKVAGEKDVGRGQLGGLGWTCTQCCIYRG